MDRTQGAENCSPKKQDGKAHDEYMAMKENEKVTTEIEMGVGKDAVDNVASKDVHQAVACRNRAACH